MLGQRPPAPLGQSGNGLQQGGRLVGRNREGQPFCFTPLDHRLAVKAAVRAQLERGVRRNPFGGLAQKPHDVAGRVGTPPAQMAEEQLPFLRPKCEQGMVADLTIVGLSRTLFAAGSLLIDAGIQVDRTAAARLLRADPLLQAPEHPLQVVHVSYIKLAQELPRSRRCRHPLHAQQLLGARISPQHFQVAEAGAPKDHIVDQPPNRVPFTIAARAGFDVEFLSQELLYPQPLGQLSEQHYPRMAGQPSLTKADVEFANLSDYAVSVHLLGASFRQDGALSHPRFCQERRHFSIFAEFSPPLLPVDSGWSFPPFCLDVVNMCLWRGTRTITLMPKDFAVLHY